MWHVDPRSFEPGTINWVLFHEREHVRLLAMVEMLYLFEERLVQMQEWRAALDSDPTFGSMSKSTIDCKQDDVDCKRGSMDEDRGGVGAEGGCGYNNEGEGNDDENDGMRGGRQLPQLEGGNTVQVSSGNVVQVSSASVSSVRSAEDRSEGGRHEEMNDSDAERRLKNQRRKVMQFCSVFYLRCVCTLSFCILCSRLGL
jgi:hypothetical protein